MKKDNEIIAEFMGYTHYNDAIGDFPEGYYCYSDSSLPMISEDFEYDTSWDWLHPVVDKIASLMPTIKIPEHLEALKNGTHGSEPYVEVVSLSISSPIEDVYKAVVTFIKWYNSQVKT